MKRPLLAGVVLSAALLWLALPLLRPRFWPADGAAWLVVLDGYHRLDAAIARQDLTGEPILLITCPSTEQPSTAQELRQRVASQHFSPQPPLVVIEQGFDTATQATALAQWLQKRQRLFYPLSIRCKTPLLKTDLLTIVQHPKLNFRANYFG